LELIYRLLEFLPVISNLKWVPAVVRTRGLPTVATASIAFLWEIIGTANRDEGVDLLFCAA
jgi:hypothetical protein